MDHDHISRLPLDMRAELIAKMDPISVINMCQINKDWNASCNNDALWNIVLDKKFGWTEGGNYKFYRAIETGLKNLVEASPIQSRYRKYLEESIYKELIPIVIQWVKLAKHDEEIKNLVNLTDFIIENGISNEIVAVLMIVDCDMNTEWLEDEIDGIFKSMLIDSGVINIDTDSESEDGNHDDDLTSDNESGEEPEDESEDESKCDCGICEECQINSGWGSDCEFCNLDKWKCTCPVELQLRR